MATSATSSVSSMLNSRTRISGFSSGLDVDSLVEKLMKVETAKVDKVKQQKQYLQWQKTAYRDFTNSLTALKNKYLDITSSSNLFSKSAFNRTKSTVADPSIVSVSGTSTSGDGTHTVTVTQIATVGAVAGGKFNTDPVPVSIDAANTKMADFTGVTAGTTVLTIGNTNYSFSADETVDQFMTRVNNAASNTNYNITYDGTKFKMELKSGGSEVNVSGTFISKAGLNVDVNSLKVLDFVNKVNGTSLTTGDALLTIDGVSYKAISADETISSFLTRVNNGNSSYKISYDSTAKRFIATTKSAGIDAGNASGAFLSAANLTTDSATPLDVSNDQNALFTIDGVAYESTSNTYTLDGLTYTFLKGGTASEPAATNVVVGKDIDGIVKNIQDFITDYNKIIANINTKTAEQKDRDYAPLTDDQKSSMKDSDIALWEEKAKLGILENDDMISGLGDKLKEAMYSKYSLGDGTEMTLSQIGIGTTSRYDMGVLTVDETKLRKALTETPEKVEALFTREYFDKNDIEHSMYDPDGDNKTREQNSGVLVKVFDILSDYVRTNGDSHNRKGFLLEKAGTTNDTTDTKNYMDDLINEQNDMINDLTSKLTEKEDYYYSKFTAMETAISNMNAQSSFLSSLSGK